MLHRAWLLLVVLSVLVQDSDTECNETNRQKLSGIVGVGYDLLTDTVKEAVYEETGFYNSKHDCFAVPNVAVVPSYSSSTLGGEPFIDCGDYSLQQLMKLVTCGDNKPCFFKEKDVPVGAFGPLYARARELFQEAEVCYGINFYQAEEYQLEIRGNKEISSRFKDCVLKIAKALMEGRMDLAKYRAETLVRDYGTHVITEAGRWASLVMFGQISKRNMEKYSVHEEGIKIAMSYSTTVMSKWFQERGGRVVALSKGSFATTFLSFKPLPIGEHTSMPSNLKRMSEFVTRVVNASDPISKNMSKLVEEVVSKYYEVNTHKGCMQANASNFDSNANVDDGSCIEYTAFGGIYNSKNDMNTVTQGIGCASGYNAIWVNEVLEHETKLFWCHSSSAKDTRLNVRAYFGGIYSGSGINPLINRKGCLDGSFQRAALWYPLQDVNLCAYRGNDGAFFELSRLKVVCGRDKSSFVCPPKYNRFDFDYKSILYDEEKCVLAACVHFLAIDYTAVRNQFEALHELPFSNVTDIEMETENEGSGEGSGNGGGGEEPNSKAAQENGEDLPIAAIVGGAVAGLLCIIIVVVIAYCIVRRMKSSSSSLPGAQPPKGSASSTSTGSSSAFNRSKTAPNTPRTVQSKTARTVPSNTQATPKKA